MDEQWWSIEVHDGSRSLRSGPSNIRSASSWRESYGQALIEAALTNGALDWAWQVRDWGVVLEIRFRDGDLWEAFRSLPAVRAALDAVPDPVSGLLISGAGRRCRRSGATPARTAAGCRSGRRADRARTGARGRPPRAATGTPGTGPCRLIWSDSPAPDDSLRKLREFACAALLARSPRYDARCGEPRLMIRCASCANSPALRSSLAALATMLAPANLRLMIRCASCANSPALRSSLAALATMLAAANLRLMIRCASCANSPPDFKPAVRLLCAASVT